MILDSKLTNYSKKPIKFEYLKPGDKEIEVYRNGSNAVIINNSERIKIENVYYDQGISGTNPYMTAREIVVKQIQKEADSLPPYSCLKILDAFRTIKTQRSLFSVVCDKIKSLYPHLTEEKVIFNAKKFCAHPDEPSHYEIPPHNSGGAVDLIIYNTALNKAWNFGTEFDDGSKLAKTLFFENEFDSKYGISEAEWNEIRCNRRILFHLMREYGFVNYSGEWWHYDLGDCIWANVLGVPWIFGSMESGTKEKN